MAYATSNPPALLVDRIGGNPAIWSYMSADSVATVTGANYFSNASDLGMAVGDVVLVTDSGTPTAAWRRVSAISSGAATVAALAS